MRLFVALDIPDTIKDKIATLRDESLDGARWTTRHQWHITLHFIGEVESDSAIRTALKTLKADSFSLKLKGVGTFPKKGKPRTLWTGIEYPPELQTLHQSTGNALQTTDFSPETRPYNPHLTLARFKKTVPSRQTMTDYQAKYDSFQTELFQAKNFVLYRSELSPQGAKYTVLERFQLLS